MKMSETGEEQSVYHKDKKDKNYNPEKEEPVTSRDLPLSDKQMYPVLSKDHDNSKARVERCIEEHKTSNTRGTVTVPTQLRGRPLRDIKSKLCNIICDRTQKIRLTGVETLLILNFLLSNNETVAWFPGSLAPFQYIIS
jgi:hypothetical protein